MFPSYPAFSLGFCPVSSWFLEAGQGLEWLDPAHSISGSSIWWKYQHYKLMRNPPWIKLHASTLEDYDFGRLQDASKMHLCAIWLLASRTENKIPWDS